VVLAIGAASCVGPRSGEVKRDAEIEEPSGEAGADAGPAPADAGGPDLRSSPDADAPADASRGDLPLPPDLPPPPADTAPTPDAAPGLKAQGQACGAGLECASGNCADGYCCNQACGGACQACAAALTGGANGSCQPMMAGTDPGDDCPAQPPASCGTDGACDGAGKCRRHGTSVTCSEASCSSGSETPAGHCNGAGACAVPAARSCGKYQCNATTLMCRKSCSADGDCNAASACEDAVCVTRCRPQSAQNKLPFAGFDDATTVVLKGTTSKWGLRDGGRWDPREDGLGCGNGAGSGAAMIDTASRPQLFSPCFPVSAGQHYFFGYMARGNAGESQLATCTVRWWDEVCDPGTGQCFCGNDLGAPRALSGTLTPSWQHLAGEVTAPAGARYADVFCGVPTFPTAWFDYFYFNPSAPRF
jgi:hypothetical protein